MSQHVIFAAPFFMDATLRFVRGATRVDGIHVSVISQDPAERLPADLRARLAGHWRIEDGLDPDQLVTAVRQLEKRLGKAVRLMGALEQLQVPLARAREALGIPGVSVEAARNFRDKSRMKDVLRGAGVPCARHALVTERQQAEAFAAKVGFPIVVKPPDGAGGKGTFRLDRASDLATFLDRYPPTASQVTLYEEFVRGTEYSFDSVVIDGRPVWHSISRYMPSPLEVLENDWIQWCVMLPRDISGPEFDPIREAAFKGLDALGLKTGLSHMEWFKLLDERIAISEVGARPPGAQFTSLLSYAHNIDFYRAWPQLMALDEFNPPPRRFAAGAAYVRGQGRGRVRRIYGLDEAQQRFGDIVVEAKLPREGQPPSDSYEGDGYIIVRHAETEVVEHALQQIVKIIRVELAE
ncbi:MAG: ATP-grasp domain-containing protein [Woeseia sp.]|nr:ATP-grasp domain-containing protein [Woeseia sp.]NNE59664.1 ATP-grasp domain-containing protein [Woeseia sp.]NNL55185.1 ATP-grasp domain-containing protein [Woeseia sp.]